MSNEPNYLNPPRGGWKPGEGPAIDVKQVAAALGKQKRRGAKGHRYEGLSRGYIAERGKLNKTEKRYLCELEERRQRGEIVRVWTEPFSLRLSRPQKGQPARVTIDFMILMPDGTTYMDDVKGTGIDNDAQRVAMKCAAEQYPLWIFRIVKLQKTGGWKVEEL